MDKQLIYREDALEIVRRTSGDYARHLLRSADCRQWTQYRLHAAGTVMAAG